MGKRVPTRRIAQEGPLAEFDGNAVVEISSSLFGPPIPVERCFEISRGFWRVADVYADGVRWVIDDPTPQERFLAASLQAELQEERARGKRG